MSFFNKLSNDTKRLKLPLVIDINGILFIPDDFRSIYNKAIEWNCKYLVSINSSSGLPLTKNGIPFPPINFVKVSSDYLFNILGGSSIIPGVTFKDTDAHNTHPDRDRLKLDDDDIINWSSLKVVLENRIRSSDLVKYDENISSNIDLSLEFTKII